MRSREESRQLIQGHVDQVRSILDVDTWPDDAPSVADDADGEALAAWAFVQGYAEALNMTAEELLEALAVHARHCRCVDCAQLSLIGG